MMTEAIYILWDHSYLWGLMALHSLNTFGASCRLVSANAIAQGALVRKPPAIMLVPGGSARQKFMALGQKGREEIRKWVSKGGKYIGFCGGAGLALEHAEGLGLCPWQRRSIADRRCHLVSGHVRAGTGAGEILLPVWWPGHFEEAGGKVEVIAAYREPGPDLWLADCPWDGADIGSGTMQIFMPGQPLAIRGAFGNGQYILSYAHPETPQSPAANAWLCSLLRESGVDAAVVPLAWDTLAPPPVHCAAKVAHARLLGLLAEAGKKGLFFPRTAWLLGWRQGAPGITCNNLLACLHHLATHSAQFESLISRQLHRSGIDPFLLAAQKFFNTLQLPPDPGASRQAYLGERDRIFSHPMHGGGIAASLLAEMAQIILAIQNANTGAT